MVGISSAPGSDLYGTYTATLIDYGDNDYGYEYENDYDNAFKACVLIRCPGETNYTAVDLQIAYEKRTQCHLR